MAAQPIPPDEPDTSEPPEHTEPFLLGDVDTQGLAAAQPAASSTLAKSPEDALAILEGKMAAVTRELAEGQINQAQFQAIYTHYAEQVAVIRRLIERNPGSDLWQRAALEGHTRFLRQQYAAAAEGVLLLDNLTGDPLHLLGRFDLPDEMLNALLATMAQQRDASSGPEPRCTQVEGGRWLSLVRGAFTTTAVLYSAEPSGVQLTRQAALHMDFERANRSRLELGHTDPGYLTFPQAALLEGETE